MGPRVSFVKAWQILGAGAMSIRESNQVGTPHQRPCLIETYAGASPLPTHTHELPLPHLPCTHPDKPAHLAMHTANSVCGCAVSMRRTSRGTWSPRATCIAAVKAERVPFSVHATVKHCVREFEGPGPAQQTWRGP